ncbi:MAG: MerR family transcriptional regulator [Candidatus Marinimicrobia bacterium]|nr:MerR family transcriptional regulator [Candidatus Neomarinimicrobiota bacterium]MCF7922433.1 MerR family transcriptional regulator [Candidatus Neomarinimicrobiota bacterium]
MSLHPITETSDSSSQSEKLYTPREVAHELSLSVESLRLYEREGLLVPYKLDSGHRRYTQSDIEWIVCIQRQIHENKLNFAGIRYILSMLPCHEMKPCCLEDQKTCPAGVASCRPCWDFDVTPCRIKGENCRTCVVYQQVLNVDNLKKILSVKFKCD